MEKRQGGQVMEKSRKKQKTKKHALHGNFPQPKLAFQPAKSWNVQV